MNTTAYKRQRAEFQDLLYQNLRRPGSQSSDTGTIVPNGIQIGAGVRAASVYRINEQGTMVKTDNPFDVAIRGRGYFLVTLPSGETAYTRAGNFTVSPEGQIVTSDGYEISPGLTIPQGATDISINANGEVLAKLDGQTTPTNVGQLDLALFINEGGLESIGDNLYLETPASGAANVGIPGIDGYGSIVQGFLEVSNVNAVQEVTNLITAQRAYEMNSRVITTADEMMRTMASLR
jgi:flagellar basal-body rod protein FlgG